MQKKQLTKFATRQSFPPAIIQLQYQACLELKKWVGCGFSDCIMHWDGRKTDAYFITDELENFKDPVLKFLDSPKADELFTTTNKLLNQFNAYINSGSIASSYNFMMSELMPYIIGTIVCSLPSKFWQDEVSKKAFEKIEKFRVSGDKIALPLTECVVTFLEQSGLPFYSNSALRPIGQKLESGFVFSKGEFLSSSFDKFLEKNGYFVEQGTFSSSEKISGNAAHKGICKGTVKVVFDVKEFGKINEGDILVTSMTKPAFAPIFPLIAAIITDEGGTLCHAAITARELNKPCIIGTKIATQVLKDGDVVEVNADKGIVKILERAK
ncbi:MAG: PEP-utilizing enzyme [Candidatus Paceibacterota bacterium]|jgi:phosphohistidine swiveling domain-containing protein